MQCPRCHGENRDGLRFGEDCGSHVTLTCAQCGGELAPGKRFCGSCGTPAASQTAASAPGPASYTPRYLVREGGELLERLPRRYTSVISRGAATLWVVPIYFSVSSARRSA
jgi:hypothetical protein